MFAGKGIGGPDGPYVAAIVQDGSGNLYVGGRFATAGGVAVNNIAKWDGASWSPLGSGITDDGGWIPFVSSLAVDGEGNIYAAGHFSDAGGVPASCIAKWDGTSWSPLGGGIGGNAGIYGPFPMLDVVAAGENGDVYVGGIFTIAGGVDASAIAKWDGNSWSPLGSGMAGGNGDTPEVSALLFDKNGNLYVGGDFTVAGGVAANCVARWEGTGWSALATGIDVPPGYGWVAALAFDGNGNLYAGGSFLTSDGLHSIAKWDGSVWSPLGSGKNGNISSLAFDKNGMLYAGGGFSIAGLTDSNNVAMWDGSTWWALGVGIDGECRVNDLVLDGRGNLYVVGIFTTAGGKDSINIAKWDAASGISGVVAQRGVPIAGVTVDLTGTATMTATTDVEGFYMFTGLDYGSYTITPSMDLYSFYPEYRTVSYSGGGIDWQNFNASGAYAVTGIITEGTASVAGVTMQLSGAEAKTAVTGSDGHYRFTGLLHGAYTVTPAKPSYTFTPGSRTINISGTDSRWKNFSGAPPTVVTITAPSPNASEAGVKGAFKVSRTGSTSAPLVVSYTVSGTATNGTDYNTLPGSVTIPTGKLSAAIQVVPVDDAELEGPETVILTLSAGSNYNVGSPGSATVKITDNEAVVTITATAPNATEWGTKGNFRVTRTGPTTSRLTVKYTVGGTATNGSDYNTLSGSVTIPTDRSFVNITVAPVDDSEAEGIETVTATLAADPKYKVGSPNSATVQIADDDTVVSITALIPNTSEAGRKGIFKVSRSGPATSALTVKYTVGGTAADGADYNHLSGSVTIPAGKSSANIVVTPVDDSVHEGMETVIATIAADPHYQVGSPASATVKIGDND
jgi:hypothetical protein